MGHPISHITVAIFPRARIDLGCHIFADLWGQGHLFHNSDFKLVLAEEVRSGLKSVNELGYVTLDLLLPIVELYCELDQIENHQCIQRH